MDVLRTNWDVCLCMLAGLVTFKAGVNIALGPLFGLSRCGRRSPWRAAGAAAAAFAAAGRSCCRRCWAPCILLPCAPTPRPATRPPNRPSPPAGASPSARASCSRRAASLRSCCCPWPASSRCCPPGAHARLTQAAGDTGICCTAACLGSEHAAPCPLSGRRALFAPSAVRLHAPSTTGLAQPEPDTHHRGGAVHHTGFTQPKPAPTTNHLTHPKPNPTTNHLTQPEPDPDHRGGAVHGTDARPGGGRQVDRKGARQKVARGRRARARVGARVARRRRAGGLWALGRRRGALCCCVGGGGGGARGS